MRSHRNINKSANGDLSNRFSFLLKCNEECTKYDFSWAAITILDHWLYEDDSFSRIAEATELEREAWTKLIKSFLHDLVKIEEPLKYKFRGLHHNKRLQFSRYVGGEEYGSYIASLFGKTYSPNIVFPKLGVDLWFEDNWTLHFKYKNQAECIALLNLAAESGLYVLPAYCAEHLNCYSELSAFMVEKGPSIKFEVRQ